MQKKYIKKILEGITWKKIFFILLGAGICSFGIHNIHERTGITEGGVIGMMLLIEHWLEISPSIIVPILDSTCYIIAFKYLGINFLKMSIISTISISIFYELWENLPWILPNLTDYPLLAAILGGVFVGVGVGLIIRQGGSSGGDDALALSISHLTKWTLSKSYLFTDFIVLGLSLSYIPIKNIVFSIITVIISSNLINHIQKIKVTK